MSDPLTDAANAISGSSPNVKRFAQLAADRILRLEAQVNPPAPPTPGPVFVQGYTATEIQALRTAGNIVAPKAYSVTFPSTTNAEFEVRQGDQYSNWSGERAQIQRPDIQGKEGDRWTWRFTLMLAPDFQFSSGFYNVLWEHHHTASSGSPPFTLQLHGNRLGVTNVNSPDPAQGNNWTWYDIAAAVAGGRYTLVVDQKLSTDSAKATTIITLDGTPKVAIGGKPNLYTGLNVYPMWGLYRAPSPLTQVVTFSPVERFA